jgi:hypothetical protein
MFVSHQWSSSQKQAQYMQAQKRKKHFCRPYNEMVWATTTSSNWFQFSFDGFAWDHADDNDEAPVVKLMKSSTFSYEQAWHRLAALYTIYRTRPFLIALLSIIYMPYMSTIRIVLICAVQNLQIYWIMRHAFLDYFCIHTWPFY